MYVSMCMFPVTIFRGLGGSVVGPLADRAKDPGFDSPIAQILISRALTYGAVRSLALRVVLGPDNLGSFTSGAFGFNLCNSRGQSLCAYNLS